MNINYREWDTSGIIIVCDGRKFVVAPVDLVSPDDQMTQRGLFDRWQAKEINIGLAFGWCIPTHEQILAVAQKCEDMKNGRSYWTDDAEGAYNPADERSVPGMDHSMELCRILCKIRCVRPYFCDEVSSAQ